jgi:hypothetical protein
MKKFTAFLALVAIIIIVSITGIYKGVITIAEKNEYKIPESTTQKTTGTESDSKVDIKDKNVIQERMLNSIHYFNTAKGTFIYASNDAGFKYEIDYKVQLNNIPKQSININTAKGKMEVYYENGEYFEVNHDKREFMKNKVPKKTGKGEVRKIKDAIKTNANGEKEYLYPDSPIDLNMASNSLNSKEIALGFLEDHNRWDVKGPEELLDREAVVLDGTFDDYYQEKLHATSFTIWMDTQTGIVLKYETYKDGKVMDYLDTKDIKINEAVDIKNSIKSDYKEFKM